MMTAMPALRHLPPSTRVFDSYWRFACERQRVYFARMEGAPPPWTDDPILGAYRFTNPYRAADRVSQYLLRHVIYDDDHDERDLVFRILLFKLFNRIETWQELRQRGGEPRVATFDPQRYAAVLDEAMARGDRIYSAAYIMPPASRAASGAGRKHHTHLDLLDQMLRDRLWELIVAARSLREVYELLVGYRGIGPFLAYQLTIDLNYAPLLSHSEMEFVQPGPGALDGVRKCFPGVAAGDVASVIRLVTESQGEHFARRGLQFRSLWGRPLQLIDCQNLFCEISKYARAAHPQVNGTTGRTRIKQRFIAAGPIPPPLFPPKWQLSVQLPAHGQQGSRLLQP